MSKGASLFGLQASTLSLFGLDGALAQSYFGKEAVQSFVADFFQFADDAVTPQNANALFNASLQVDQSVNGTASGGNYAADYAAAVNAALSEHMGITLDNIHYNTGADGNLNIAIDGYGTHTVDISDLLAQALEQANAQLAGMGFYA